MRTAGAAIVLIGSFFSVIGMSGVALFIATFNDSRFDTTQVASFSTSEQLEDLEFLVDQIKTDHFNPFYYVSEEEFDNKAEEIEAQIGELDEAEFYASLKSLISLIRDSHTDLYDAENYSYFPLTLEWYGEDLVVTGAVESYEDIIGGRVTSYAGLEPDEFLEQLDEYVTSEDPGWVKAVTFYDGTDAKLLDGMGLLEQPSMLPVTVEKDGMVIDEVLSINQLYDVYLHYYEMEGIASPIKDEYRVYSLNREFAYLYHASVINDGETGYFQLNNHEDDPFYSLESFIDDSKTIFEDPSIESVVVDLRYNTGGYPEYYREWMVDLSSWERKNPGKVHVLIGNSTMSAGVYMSDQLDELFDPVFYGEPTGGMLDTFSILEDDTEILPNSRFVLQIGQDNISTERNPDFYRYDLFKPDVTVIPDYEDFLQAADPVLERALADF